jgi:DUF971 family protein
MTAPAAVRNATRSGLLHLQWPSGPEMALTHGQLRSRCPCSHCRAARLIGRIDLVDEAVRVVECVNQGYGVQLIFSDGHALGIYPWRYLKELAEQKF